MYEHQMLKRTHLNPRRLSMSGGHLEITATTVDSYRVIVSIIDALMSLANVVCR